MRLSSPEGWTGKDAIISSDLWWPAISSPYPLDDEFLDPSALGKGLAGGFGLRLGWRHDSQCGKCPVAGKRKGDLTDWIDSQTQQFALEFV